ncbi:DUF6907 domain-containing protein [Nocardioides humi]|uniref:Uncharacterized protein n=1 Tax=Nocardioides humi TaxID=449461 RepID=A0ABN2AMK4_9ACTN|nr:hypothetical protein [Nocardioides humi]
MTDREAPTWLTEPCPAWCEREHLEDDHPEDRYHQSAVVQVPVVAGPRAIPMTARLVPLEMTVRIGRHLGERRVWLALEPAEGGAPSLVLSAESGSVLAAAIDEVLAGLG